MIRADLRQRSYTGPVEIEVRGAWHARLLRRLNGAIDHLLSGPNWMSKALGAVLAISLFRTFPNYDALQTAFFQNTWRDVQIKFDHPLLDMGRIFPAGSHESNLTFRLTVPMLAHFFHLHQTGLLILFALVGIVLLYLVLSVAFAISASRRAALFLCLSTACAWPGVAAFQDLRGGYYDALALCLVVAACAVRSPLLGGSFVFLAAWTDERALLASSLVFLLSALNNKNGVRRLMADKPAAVVIAAAAYLGIRAYLTFARSYAAPSGIGVSIFMKQVHVIPLAIWTGLAGSWLLVAAGLVGMLRHKRYWAAIGFCGALAGLIASSLAVVDVTRGMSYCLPAVFVALAAVTTGSSTKQIERLAALCALISLLAPTYYLEGATGSWWLYPLPVQLARWL